MKNNTEMIMKLSSLQADYTDKVFEIADEYNIDRVKLFCDTVESFKFMGLLLLSGVIDKKELK